MPSDIVSSIQSQVAAEQVKIQQQQQQQQQELAREAEELRRKQREIASAEEQAAQQKIAEFQKAEETAQRKRVIGIEPDKKRLAEAKKEAIKEQETAISESRKAKKEIAEAEETTKKEISTATEETLKDLEAQQTAALNEVEKLRKDNVELDNGEWISKESYNKLSTEEQILINKVGIEKFNKIKEKEYETFKQNNVQLEDGTWIDKKVYDSLPPEQQEILRTKGIAGLTAYQTEQINLSNEESWQQLQTLISSTGVSSSVTREQWDNMSPEEKQNTYSQIYNTFTRTIGNNEVVAKVWYDALSPEFKAIVDEGGTTALDKYIEDKYVTTKTEELIDREYYNTLTPEQKDYITNYGVDKFNDKYFVKLAKTGEFINRTEYNKLSDEAKNILQTKGIAGLEEYNKKQQEEFDTKYVRLDNGDYVDRASYDKMDSEERSMLKKLGVADYNAKKEKEFYDSLPKDAQEHYKLIGKDKFIDTLQSTDKMNDISAFSTLQQMGMIPKEAQMIKRKEDGSFEYKMPENGYTVDLESIDFNKITSSDFKNIIYTVSNSPKYKATEEDMKRSIIPITGTPGKFMSKAEQIAYEKWYNTLSAEQQKQVKKALKDYENDKFVDILSFVFPPAEALKSEVTVSDIKGTDWATGIANLALLVAAPAVGLIGKAGTVAAKVGSAVGRGIQAGAAATYGITTVVEWKNMDAKEKAISIGLNAIVALPLMKTTVTALAAKLNPKGAAIKALRNNEKLIAKEFTQVLEKSYSPSVAKSYKALAKVQNSYIKAVYKGSTALKEKLAINLEKKALKFTNELQKATAKIGKGSANIKYVNGKKVKVGTYKKNIKITGKTGSLESFDELTSLSKSIVKNTENMVKTALQPKLNIKQLQKKVASLEKKYAAIKDKSEYVNKYQRELDALKEKKAKLVKDKSSVKEVKTTTKQTKEEITKPTKEQVISSDAVEYNGKYWRLVKDGEVFEPGKSFRMDMKTGKNYVEINKDKFNLLNKSKAEKHYQQDIGAKEKLTKTEPKTTKKESTTKTELKDELKSIDEQIAKLENELKSAKKANKEKGDVYIELLEAQIQLKHFTSTPISVKAQQLTELREQLTTLKNSKPTTKVGRIEKLKNTNALETKIKNLEKDILQDLKSSEVEWAKESGSYKGGGGGTAVAERTVTSPTRISGSLAAELKRKGRTLPSMGGSGSGSSAGTKPAETTSTKLADAISTQTIKTEKISEDEVVTPKTTTTTLPKTTVKSGDSLQSAITTITNTGINAAVDAINKNVPINKVSNITKSEIQSAIQTIPDAKLQEQLKTQTEQMVKTAVKIAERVKTIKPTKNIILVNKDGKEVELTKEQLKAAVGWKQGFVFWYIYPPAYGKNGKDRIVTRKPIKGIPLYKDAKSAYRSLTKIGIGDLPEVIKIPMGITTMRITTKKGGKPRAKYEKNENIRRIKTVK